MNKPLPKNWRIKKIKDFAEVITGGTPRTSVKEYWQNGNIPWLPSGDLKDCEINSAHKFITKEGLNNSAAKIMPIQTVLIALTGATTGQIGILNIEASANQSVTGILPSKEHIPKYLFYYLRSQRRMVLEKSYGGAQKHISQGFVKEMEIALPPLETQKEIVKILEIAEYLKEKRKKLNKKTKEVLKSTFYEMFGDPISNNKGYPIKTLKEVCEKITDGTHATPKYVAEGIPFLRVTDLTNSNDTKKYISKEEHEALIKRCKPEKGDVLYTKNGTIGIAKVVNWDYEFSIFVSLCLMKPNKEIILPKYLEAFLNTPFALSQAKSHSKKGTITNLHLIEIKKILLPLPSIKEQKKFIEVAQKVGMITHHQEKSTQEINNLFDALSQKAFKGEL